MKDRIFVTAEDPLSALPAIPPKVAGLQGAFNLDLLVNPKGATGPICAWCGKPGDLFLVVQGYSRGRHVHQQPSDCYSDYAFAIAYGNLEATK